MQSWIMYCNSFLISFLCVFAPLRLIFFNQCNQWQKIKIRALRKKHQKGYSNFQQNLTSSLHFSKPSSNVLKLTNKNFLLYILSAMFSAKPSGNRLQNNPNPLQSKWNQQQYKGSCLQWQLKFIAKHRKLTAVRIKLLAKRRKHLAKSRKQIVNAIQLSASRMKLTVTIYFCCE